MLIAAINMAATEERRIAVGSRKSQLALAQTQLVCEAVARAHPGLAFDVVSMDTAGDKVLASRCVSPVPALRARSHTTGGVCRCRTGRCKRLATRTYGRAS
jgi:hypothetical protein